nr:putative reverse transcriptase domain-containing protein [Tanacetum cinerariifolium]
MNGWLIEDDDEEVEEDEIGDEDDEEVEVNDEDEDDGVDDNEDEVKVINAYEEFGQNFHVKEGSSVGALLARNNEVNAHGLIACNLESVQRVATRLNKKMFDRYMIEKKMVKKFKEDEFRMNGHEYDITALDAKVRKNSSEHSEMKKERIPTEMRFEEEPPLYTTSAPRVNDPYVMVRDVAKADREDEDDDVTTPKDPQPSEPLDPYGLLAVVTQKLVADKVAKALAIDRAARNDPNVAEGSELCRWFKKIESVFRISEYTERSKVKFAAAILQVPTEKKKVKLYIKGLLENIKGETTSSRPTVLNEAFQLGMFDIVIRMDWLVERDAVILCGKKKVHIPVKNEVLVVKGNEAVSRLKVISCIKARKYVEKGSQFFISHVMEKEPLEKRFQDVPLIHDFPEVFPDNLPGLLPP